MALCLKMLANFMSMRCMLHDDAKLLVFVGAGVRRGARCRDGGPGPTDRSWRIIDPDGLDIAPCRQVHQTPCDDKTYFTSHLLPCIYHIL